MKVSRRISMILLLVFLFSYMNEATDVYGKNTTAAKAGNTAKTESSTKKESNTKKESSTKKNSETKKTSTTNINSTKNDSTITKDNTKEFQGVWISYIEFGDRLKDPTTGEIGFTKKRFQDTIDEMFDNVASLKMNAVIVQVRAFGDAMYPSEYFPWSYYISGTQGKNPGFDPLAYMVTAAHSRGLEFHAWLNPYRVTSGHSDVSRLAKTNPARIWRTDKSTKNDRAVLTFDGSLYYNPANQDTRELIVNGVKEIVKNYDVDGIHFDDYFYPMLGKNYKKNFDATEYKAYVAECKEKNTKAYSIVTWRKYNVNTLLKEVYSSIKKINKDVVFGVSPAGSIDNLSSKEGYYCDVQKWLSKSGYVDYIAPQLYWSFDHKRLPFNEILNDWIKLHTNKNINLYVGLPTYRAGSKDEAVWSKDNTILKNMVLYGRKTKKVDGYMHFRYDFFYNKTSKAGVTQMLKII